jgi:hypothetical protein
LNTCGSAQKEVDQDWKVFISGEVSPARVADERIAPDGVPIVDRQLRLRVEQELSPEWTKLLWELRHHRQTMGPQRRDSLADPSADAIAGNCEAGARTEKVLANELIVSTGSGQVSDELVAA